MNIFKRRISLILSAIMIATAILPIIVVNAASTVDYKATIGGKTVAFGKVNEVNGGEKCIIQPTSDLGKITHISYQFGTDGKLQQYAGEKIQVTIPESDGSTTPKQVSVRASGVDASGKTFTGDWQWFFVKYVEKETPQVDMTITLGTKVLKHMSVLNVNGGETIKVKAKSSEADIYMIGYYYHKTSDGDTIDIHDDEIEIVLPKEAPGTEMYLFIEAVAANDDGTPNLETKTGWVQLYLVYEEEEADEP